MDCLHIYIVPAFIADNVRNLGPAEVAVETDSGQ